MTEIVSREPAFQELTFQIDGMHCGSCVQRVTRALNQVPGTQVDEVRVGAARIHADAEAPDAYVAYIGAIRKAGYEAHLVE
jgi:copper chaperone